MTLTIDLRAPRMEPRTSGYSSPRYSYSTTPKCPMSFSSWQANMTTEIRDMRSAACWRTLAALLLRRHKTVPHICTMKLCLSKAGNMQTFASILVKREIALKTTKIAIMQPKQSRSERRWCSCQSNQHEQQNRRFKRRTKRDTVNYHRIDRHRSATFLSRLISKNF